jgi:hypothetical protein
MGHDAGNLSVSIFLMTRPTLPIDLEASMQHEDITIMTTDVHEVQEDGKRTIRFRVQLPGRVSLGQESEFDVRSVRQMIANWETSAPSLPKVIELGQVLGDALFPAGHVRDAVLASLSAHRNRHDSRLRLILNLDGPLHTIPWEFALLHTEQGEATQNEMLGLMSQVSIIRQLDHTVPRLAGTRAADLPAQVVVSLADPADRLNLQDERKIVQDSIDQMKRVEVTYVEPATSGNLLGGREHVDIFHFAGHGDFVERPTPGTVVGKGALVLDDGHGNSEMLDAAVLAPRLVNAGVRVAVLGACLTAKRDDVNMWSSTAANLLNGGLGAVVAMQFTVRDASAIAFARAFYDAITLGFPVDLAVTKGRLAIFAKEDFRGFGTPVLYMSASDGILFPELTNDPTLQAERQRLQAVVTVEVTTVAGEVVGMEIGTMAGGDAEVNLVTTTIEEGAIAIGVIADVFTGGSLTTSASADRVEKHGKLIGAKLDSFGGARSSTRPSKKPSKKPSKNHSDGERTPWNR